MAQSSIASGQAERQPVCVQCGTVSERWYQPLIGTEAFCSLLCAQTFGTRHYTDGSHRSGVVCDAFAHTNTEANAKLAQASAGHAQFGQHAIGDPADTVETVAVLRVSPADRKAINNFAREHRHMAVYSHCESAYRTDGETQSLNLADFGITEPGSIGDTDLSDFGPRLANLRTIPVHASGFVVVDFYVYGRDRVGAETQLDTNVQAVWRDGVLVALSEGSRDIEWLNGSQTTPDEDEADELDEDEERHSDWYVWSEDGSQLEAILSDADLAVAKLNGTVTISGGKHVLTSYGRMLLDRDA